MIFLRGQVNEDFEIYEKIGRKYIKSTDSIITGSWQGWQPFSFQRFLKKVPAV